MSKKKMLSRKKKVATVYLHVIEDVVVKLQKRFLKETGNDSAIRKFQTIWELKLMMYGVTVGPIKKKYGPSGLPPLLHPPPAGEGKVDLTRTKQEVKTEEQELEMELHLSLTKQSSASIDVNVACEETREEKGRNSEPQSPTEVVFRHWIFTAFAHSTDFYALLFGEREWDGHIAQQDGSGDICLECSIPEKIPMARNSSTDGHAENFNRTVMFPQITKANPSFASKTKRKDSSLTIPQYDGINDNYDGFICTEDYNTVAPYHDTPPRIIVEDLVIPKCEFIEDEIEDDEPPSDEEDDLNELDDLEELDEIPPLDGLIVGQFEEVWRKKNRWKCYLKAVVIRLNDTDYVFRKAKAQFEF